MVSFIKNSLLTEELKKKLYSPISLTLSLEDKYYATVQDNNPGVTSFEKEAKTQLEYVQLFMTDDHVTMITLSRNFFNSYRQKNILRKHIIKLYRKLMCNHSLESCTCAVHMVWTTMKYQFSFLTYKHIHCIVPQCLG